VSAMLITASIRHLLAHYVLPSKRLSAWATIYHVPRRHLELAGLSYKLTTDLPS